MSKDGAKDAQSKDSMSKDGAKDSAVQGRHRAQRRTRRARPPIPVRTAAEDQVDGTKDQTSSRPRQQTPRPGAAGSQTTTVTPRRRRQQRRRPKSAPRSRPPFARRRASRKPPTSTSISRLARGFRARYTSIRCRRGSSRSIRNGAAIRSSWLAVATSSSGPRPTRSSTSSRANGWYSQLRQAFGAGRNARPFRLVDGWPVNSLPAPSSNLG